MKGKSQVSCSYWRILCILIFLISFYAWLAIHESAHYLACEFMGGTPSLVSYAPKVSLQCEGIYDDGYLIISHIGYFMYMMLPYIIAFIICASLFFFAKRRGAFLFVFVAVIIADISLNYIMTMFSDSDFRTLAYISPSLAILGACITLAT
ncbi:TPA: hypothetical protein HA265_03285, partial [Candidatus Woesearchaeota archaeon]|nr:hypothetical protein [Candidatus Woesearchaeota archaeon]